MKQILVFVTLLAILLAPFSDSGATGLSLSVQEINQKINAQRAGWQAKENWVTQLPREQIRRMLGVAQAPDSSVEFTAPEGGRSFFFGPVPSAIDWRRRDGVNYVSPILNQGNCGSCVAFASVATLEDQINISSRIPNLNPSFSTQALFSCGGGACEFGWMPHLAARHLVNKGVPDEACAPYTMGATGETVACSTTCKDSAARSLKILKYTEPTRGTKDIESVKAALQRGPLMTTLMVYEDFISYAGGIYRHVAGGSLGGHAVTIIGYDEATRSWIIRNSWGPEWGESGFGRVSWDDVSGISNATWGFEVPAPDGYVTVKNPHGRQFLAGEQDIEVESTFADTVSLDVSIVKPAESPAAIRTFNCADRRCVFKLDTQTLANGYYQVFARATLKAGAASVSPREQFFVHNGKPDLKLTYSPMDGADLTKPLKGRIVFKVSSSTGSEVPLSSIVFHVSDGTQDVLTRTTDIVLPEMTIGWRTNSSRDGRFQIWFTGKLKTSKGEVIFESEKTNVTIANGSARR